MIPEKRFPQDFLRCGKPLIDPQFYRPSDAPISPCWPDEERAEWEYWNEQERLATEQGSEE